MRFAQATHQVGFCHMFHQQRAFLLGQLAILHRERGAEAPGPWGRTRV